MSFSLYASVQNRTLKLMYLIAVFSFFYRYYDQLCSIEPKFPFSENQVGGLTELIKLNCGTVDL